MNNVAAQNARLVGFQVSESHLVQSEAFYGVYFGSFQNDVRGVVVEFHSGYSYLYHFPQSNSQVDFFLALVRQHMLDRSISVGSWFNHNLRSNGSVCQMLG
jgi:hypothetical protein